MPIFRRLNEKDLAPRQIGKTRRYRLSRNDATVAFAGTLLAVYRHTAEDEDDPCPMVTHLTLIALFRTRRGRFLAYYVVDHRDNEHISGKHEYLKVCETFEELEAFTSRMLYVNGERFRERIVAEARATLFPASAAPDEAGKGAQAASEVSPDLPPASSPGGA